jgi:hypothetical protein
VSRHCAGNAAGGEEGEPAEPDRRSAGQEPVVDGAGDRHSRHERRQRLHDHPAREHRHVVLLRPQQVGDQGGGRWRHGAAGVGRGSAMNTAR